MIFKLQCQNRNKNGGCAFTASPFFFIFELSKLILHVLPLHSGNDNGRQLVVAVPKTEAGDWIAFFTRICLAATAARTFRRDHGSGLKVGLSAAEQLAIAANSTAGKAARFRQFKIGRNRHGYSFAYWPECKSGEASCDHCIRSHGNSQCHSTESQLHERERDYGVTFKPATSCSVWKIRIPWPFIATSVSLNFRH